MSTHTERSAWSPDEVDSLENIDKEVQLVSTSTESVTNPSHGNRSAGNEKAISDNQAVGRRYDLKLFHSKSSDNINGTKLNLSCDDLSLWGKNNSTEQNKGGIIRSNTFINYKPNKKTNKYDHIQSKIKLNFNNSTKIKLTPPKIPVISECTNKEGYLEQVNKQLIKELDEKNAILSLLQENYEHLLFKYAEAQNRIDELRFKFLTKQTETKNFPADHTPHYFNEDYMNKIDVKCQKAVVTPFIKLNKPSTPPNEEPFIARPSSLPLDTSFKFGERDLLKATTPTDSEGLSSIITSMSGHSKIINSLDEENQIHKKSNYKYHRNNFVLEENSALNDPFDKVKNWQNSLPPLEQIETPETTLYNISNNYKSPNKYKELPKVEKDCISDESCPPSWKEESQRHRSGRYEINRNGLQSKSKYNNENERFHEEFDHKNDVPPTNIIQKRKKRPPLLRCSSLPAYDCDSIRSGSFKNGIYIPPLDLGNVTLSDEESYCQQDYYVNNVVTSSSFVTSRGSVDRSIQTPESFSCCKKTISEERVPRQTISKSTSITPDRNRGVDLVSGRSEEPVDWCNICGQSISESNRIYRNKSCESVHSTDMSKKEVIARRPKPPFTRSVSFGSETNTPKFCLHEKQISRGCLSSLSQESVENFDIYASNLKARSQVAIKALAAHVNKS